MDSQIRHNPLTGQWVIYSKARGQRPHDFDQDADSAANIPDHSAACPFCPGNEHILGEVVFELPGNGPHGWATRVIPNKFPALRPGNDPTRRSDGLYLWLDGHGRHEVIIESPKHNTDIALMSQEEVLAVIETYFQRYHAYNRKHDGMYVVIFRNHGPKAGTSLIHPHSQAIVTPVVPHQVRYTNLESLEYFDRMGKCLMCALLKQELQDGSRLIDGNDHFVCFVPYAAETPFELWIVPRGHQPDFGTADPGQRAALADILRRVLALLSRRLNNPSYNYIINTPPRFRRHEPALHWYLRIRPRLTTRAGFEIGSGMSINPRLPEEDAAYLLETS